MCVESGILYLQVEPYSGKKQREEAKAEIL